jgi:hypothetical protein
MKVSKRKYQCGSVLALGKVPISSSDSRLQDILIPGEAPVPVHPSEADLRIVNKIHLKTNI